MKSAVVALFVSLGVLGCVTHQTQEGSRVRAMTELDKPRCSYITDVGADGHWWLPFPRFPDTEVDDQFNDLLNEVALVGGDAYVIRNPAGYYYRAEAWNCAWSDRPSQNLAKINTEPREISAEERTKCDFKETFAEASYWGMTHERNYRNARTDAINLVREVGGDSYYVAYTVIRYGTNIVILEAYRCSFDDNLR